MSIKQTLALVVFGAMCVPVVALAADIRVGDALSISSDEKIASNLYVAGGTVKSAAQVDGDFLAAGGDVSIEGPVAQDIAVAGGTLLIPNAVGGDLRALGGDIKLTGSVRGDVIAVGGQTELSGSGVEGDVLWAGGTITITTPVKGNIQLRGGEVIIDAPIQGNVYFKGQKLSLGSHAAIKGALTYSSPKEASISQGATVLGKIDYTATEPAVSPGAFAAIATFAFFTKFLMTFACALVFGLMLKTYAHDLVETAMAQPMAELGRGFVSIVILPVASIVLLTTVIGIPLGVLGLLAFVAILVITSIAAPVVLGSIIHKWLMKLSHYEVSWVTILIGVAAYLLLTLIPVVGSFVKILVALITIGAMMKMKWETIQDWR